jgi:hypothetical protein
MQDLPTIDELELAAFSLSHFGSELDSFESTVHCAAALSGDTTPADRDAIAHVLAFAADARNSIGDVLKDLEKLEAHALTVYHDTVDGEAYWQRVSTALIEDGTRLRGQAVNA